LAVIDVARRVIETASQKQALDIILLDVGETCLLTSYFIILSGESPPQIESLSSAIGDVLREEKEAELHHIEGTATSGWVLLDAHSIIVHIFSPEQREYYKLEKLWNRAKLLVRIQ
jgi:ribosome-associated protein